MILVSGATGNVGGELVRQLAANGHPVRGVVRHADSDTTLPKGVEAAFGDLDAPESLRGALTHVEGVFFLPGYRDMPGLAAEARRAGIKRVVQLSGPSAAVPGLTDAISRYMVASEAAIRDSGLPWTILRPSGFMSNTFQWRAQLAGGDHVRDQFADVAVAMIDPHDIAAVAMEALLGDAHEGATYRLTGPEPLRPVDRVRILGDVLGRDLRFEAKTNDEARRDLSAAMPADYVEAFFSFYVDGTLDDSEVLPTVAEITGRPARTFRDWAQTHASGFSAPNTT
jgi:uncharacterized protein YbjT (DUF2867 family)